MIDTFYGLGELVLAPTAMTFLVSLVIGLFFGFALEKAGFGSSRRLAGIFYFRDMAVLKVMFTALVTAMLGLQFVVAMGWIDLESQVNLLPTFYITQAVAGVAFGVGFVMSGWCPGTAAVGTASGKFDAVVFLVGVVGGSIAYNETYAQIAPLRDLGEPGEVLTAFGLPTRLFALIVTVVAVAAFFFAEWVERKAAGGGKYLSSRFLHAFSVGLVVVALVVFMIPTETTAVATPPPTDQELLESIESGEDHLEPETLADWLLRGEPGLLVIDVRSPIEYNAFHIRGAVNVQLPGLLDYLAGQASAGTIVLYSNGMTHPAQARDVLARQGYQNVYLLTDGLTGFKDRCLKPVSLRDRPLPDEQAARVRAWRTYFVADDVATAFPPAPATPAESLTSPGPLPGLVSTDWLSENLGRPGLKVIDVRGQKAYNTSHLRGALRLDVENFRGMVGGVGSILLPAEMLAERLSLLGIEPSDTVVLVPGDAVRDATVIGMGLDRLGHRRWAILEGGFTRWVDEGRPIHVALPQVEPSDYPPPATLDDFTADYREVESRLGDGRTIILDTRPVDYFAGEKTDEARAGHIPGAVNRPFSEDLDEAGNLKPTAELAAVYEALIPAKDTPVVVHCRTGHQASQTFFVLKHLLGYENVQWYDAGWSEWAARPELPVEK